jgi:dUTP pyrophosphatase
MPLFVKKLDPRATVPTCAHPGEDLAYDLYALEDIRIGGPATKVRTGIAMQHDRQYECLTRLGFLLRDRSSMAAKGVFVTGGVIDAGYTGEIIVLMSTILTSYQIKAGDKIVQAVPFPVLTAEIGPITLVEGGQELIGTRGDKGFGSSGR